MIDSLPVDYRNMVIHLHPRDASLIKKEIKNYSQYSEQWKIIEHDTLSPGGCIVETDTSLINATVDQRVEQMVQQIYDQEVMKIPGLTESSEDKEQQFVSSEFSDVAQEIADEQRILPNSNDVLPDVIDSGFQDDAKPLGDSDE